MSIIDVFTEPSRHVDQVEPSPVCQDPVGEIRLPRERVDTVDVSIKGGEVASDRGGDGRGSDIVVPDRGE
jgi:hypothetical protein